MTHPLPEKIIKMVWAISCRCCSWGVVIFNSLSSSSSSSASSPAAASTVRIGTGGPETNVLSSSPSPSAIDDNHLLDQLGFFLFFAIPTVTVLFLLFLLFLRCLFFFPFFPCCPLCPLCPLCPFCPFCWWSFLLSRTENCIGWARQYCSTSLGLFNTTWSLKISKIEKRVSIDHTRNCIQT